jgi:hypothetical protein
MTIKELLDALVTDPASVPTTFARECALSVVHLWAAPEVVVNYLKTGDPLNPGRGGGPADDEGGMHACSRCGWRGGVGHECRRLERRMRHTPGPWVGERRGGADRRIERGE